MLYPNPNFLNDILLIENLTGRQLKLLTQSTPKTQSDIRAKVRLLNRRLALMLYPNPKFFKGHFTN